jgi:hypothetical protein
MNKFVFPAVYDPLVEPVVTVTAVVVEEYPPKYTFPWESEVVLNTVSLPDPSTYEFDMSTGTIG